MGRVAKYKKLKSCDPYSKKNRGKVDLQRVGVWGFGDDGRKAKKRSKKAERMQDRKNKIKNKKKSKNKFVDDGGFDVPPMEKDEFDMSDLIGSVKKQKVETQDVLGSDETPLINTNAAESNKKLKAESYDKIVTSTGNVACIPKTDEDEIKVARLLRLNEQEEKKLEKEKQLKHARMEGESKNAYRKRTRTETRQIIKQTTMTKNQEKLEKKKEFLKNKKSKKRKGGGSGLYKDEDYRDYDYDETPSSYDNSVRFGEQAERPPTFRQIPRGAKSKSKTAQSSKSLNAEGMSEHQIDAERHAMELMRRRVQAQYKAIKAKRKDLGDFHL